MAFIITLSCADINWCSGINCDMNMIAYSKKAILQLNYVFQGVMYLVFRVTLTRL